jgi:hypothetical protein
MSFQFGFVQKNRLIIKFFFQITLQNHNVQHSQSDGDEVNLGSVNYFSDSNPFITVVYAELRCKDGMCFPGIQSLQITTNVFSSISRKGAFIRCAFFNA